MHADFFELGRQTRERIVAPAVPLASIRAAAASPAKPPRRRRSVVAVVLAALSLAAVATATQMVHQAHLTFIPLGGMVVSSNGAKLSSRSIRTNDDIRGVAQGLDFKAVLPAGLPADARPIKVDTAGTSLIVITYALPASRSGRNHNIWIFLVNPAAVTGSSAAHYRSRHGYRSEQWRVGAEQVIVVSDALTTREFHAIRAGMLQSGPTP